MNTTLKPFDWRLPVGSVALLLAAVIYVPAEAQAFSFRELLAHCFDPSFGMLLAGLLLGLCVAALWSCGLRIWRGAWLQRCVAIALSVVPLFLLVRYGAWLYQWSR